MNLNNVKLNLDTEIVYNVGHPINKTNAPIVYNKLFEELDMNAIMLPVDIKKGQLKEFLDACRLMGIHYICPTMPHKGDFVPLLDDVDETSRLLGSVNAIRIDLDGTTHGVGMDGKGAVRAMKLGGARFQGIHALMYGAGSISRVIGYELYQEGVKKLTIANKFPEESDEVARVLRNTTDMEVETILPDPELLDRAAGDAELMMNVTPLGMAGFPAVHPYLGFIDYLPKTATVFDSIINPPKSETILAGEKNGLNVVPGMKMLVAQMDLIFKFLFNREINEKQKEAALDELCKFLGVDHS
jgi:shikimate dehydrogenase